MNNLLSQTEKAKIENNYSCPNRVVLLTIFISGYDKGNLRIIYRTGEENETSYFKWTYNCFLRRGEVKSRSIKDGAYNKDYPTELKVFSNRFATVIYLDSFPFKKNQKKKATTAAATTTKSTTDQSPIPSLFPESNAKQEIALF